MVSGGTVNGDLSSLQTSLSNYNSEITGLSGSWTGPSHDNLVSKAEAFYSEYLSALQSQMGSFASACDLYQEYATCKQNISIAQSNYNQAVANKDNSAANRYSSEVSSLQSKLSSLKSQIESLLAAAGSVSLQASSNSSSSSSSFTAGQALSVAPGVYDYTFTSSAGKEMKYHVYIPNNAKEGMPLILYLHGDGSVGRFDHLKDSEMAACVKKAYGDDYPFIYIQPMTEVTSWSDDGRLDTLAELVQQVTKDYKCDPNKVVLTGASRGGIGSWQLANAHSELFSAFVPVSGYGNKLDLSKFVNLPTIAVSTPDSSDDWNYQNMKSNVKKINEAGGNATFVSKDGYSHSSVIKGTYTTEMYDWMISQTRSV